MTTHQGKVGAIAKRIFPTRDAAVSCGDESCNAICASHGKCVIFEKSDQQLEYVVSSGQSDIFLSACPGSGKTEVVGLKAAYEMQAWEKRYCGIAILTFTNNATDEIRKRLQQYAGIAKSGHPHFIGTVDSWLHRYLAHPFGSLITGYSGRPYQSSIDKSVRLVDDDEREGWINSYRCKTPYYYLDKRSGIPRPMPLYANNLKFDLETNVWQLRIPNGNKLVGAADYFTSPAVSAFRSSNSWLTQELMIKGFADTKDRFLRDGFATHDDIEWVSKQILESHGVIRERLARRFPLIVIDECQDLSWLQLKILGLLNNAGSRLHFVGDLNQAIYEFKEVEPGKIEAFVKERSFDIAKLTENFRSCQPIVDICCKLVPSSPIVGKVAISHNPTCICFAYSGSDELRLLPSRFIKYLEQQTINPNKSAVLARGWATVRRLQNLPNEQPTNDAIKLAMAIDLWAARDPRLWEDSLRFLGDFISSKYFKERSGSRRYHCPESINSLVSWRLFLAEVLKTCTSRDFELFNLDQLMPAWAESVRKSFGEIIRSHVPTLEAALEGKLTVIEDLNGDTFKAPPNTKNHKVVDKLVRMSPRSDKIKTMTIHSAKGRTFEAVLLVSSPTQQGGMGGHWGEWLENNKSESARFAYVASSRPRRLLAWAIPLSKDPTADLQRMIDLGFAPADLSEWKKTKRRKAPSNVEGQGSLFDDEQMLR